MQPARCAGEPRTAWAADGQIRGLVISMASTRTHQRRSAAPAPGGKQAVKVNIKGEQITLDSTRSGRRGTVGQCRYGVATQTLPNDYCGLSIQKGGPHVNACLTCPVFITGTEFLPDLRDQRRRTLALVETSAGNGQAWVAK